jgi:hypothetical protein
MIYKIFTNKSIIKKYIYYFIKNFNKNYIFEENISVNKSNYIKCNYFLLKNCHKMLY